MAMKKKMKGNITSPALPGKSILAEVNNNEAGNIYNSLFAKNRKVEYDNKYIALVNIRTNPDNQIFRVMDDDEDIRILADIFASSFQILIKLFLIKDTIQFFYNFLLLLLRLRSIHKRTLMYLICIVSYIRVFRHYDYLRF